MKHLFACTIVCLLQFAVLSQPKTDWQLQELKGKVKSLRSQQTYRYKKDGISFTPWERTYGRLTLFNSEGMKTEFSEFTNKDSLSYKITYAYNKKNKTADVTNYDKALRPVMKTSYKYDDKGFKIEELQYTRDGKPDRRYVYTHDSRGNILTMKGFKSDGNLLSTTTYQYDDKGHRIEYKYEMPGYATSIRKYKNDAKGNAIEEISFDESGEFDFKYLRTYDEKGNKIKEERYSSLDAADAKPVSSTSWRYEYDKKGNWIKRTQTTGDGTDFHIEERTIIYY